MHNPPSPPDEPDTTLGAGQAAATRPGPEPPGRGTDGAPLDISSSSGGPSGPGDRGAGEEDVALHAALAERDEYLDSLRRLQAEFENYRKRVAKGQAEQVERAAGDLVSKLLPVLDTLDAALAHLTGAASSPGRRAQEVDCAGLAQVGSALTDALTREGLERISAQGQAFDPTLHDAVIHDPDGDGGAPQVTEELRAGYLWKGRVLRPTMVKVRG